MRRLSSLFLAIDLSWRKGSRFLFIFTIFSLLLIFTPKVASAQYYLSFGASSQFHDGSDDAILLKPQKADEAALSDGWFSFCSPPYFRCDEAGLWVVAKPGSIGKIPKRLNLYTEVLELDQYLLGVKISTHQVSVMDSEGKELYFYYWSCERGVTLIAISGWDSGLAKPYILREAYGLLAGCDSKEEVNKGGEGI